MPTSSFSENYRKFLPRVVFATRKIYVGAYNIYGFYWLYKMIWVLPFDWEKLLIWFFAMGGLFFFILNNRSKLSMNDYMKEVE